LLHVITPSRCKSHLSNKNSLKVTLNRLSLQSRRGIHFPGYKLDELSGNDILRSARRRGRERGGGGNNLLTAVRASFIDCYFQTVEPFVELHRRIYISFIIHPVSIYLKRIESYPRVSFPSLIFPFPHLPGPTASRASDVIRLFPTAIFHGPTMHPSIATRLDCIFVSDIC